MRLCVVMPVHNEEAYIGQCLDSFVRQTRPPDQLILVDDHSTDHTPQLLHSFAKKHSFIHVLRHKSSEEHRPGAKVIQAFMAGYQQIEKCDLIGKFDADIVLPENYFETLEKEFLEKPKLGLAGGHLYIHSGKDWVYEPIANEDHIRGPIKLYRKEALEDIGGLAPQRGWDSVDRWKLEFRKWETRTFKTLKVKHLRPTGQGYSKQRVFEKGRALGQMRFDPLLAAIAVIKASKIGSPSWGAAIRSAVAMYRGYLQGVLGKSHLTTREEGRFLRQQRWRGVKKALTSKRR